jgi:hypothetical protein
MLYGQEIRNYRDWLAIDTDLWRHYWFGMVNRGVMPQPLLVGRAVDNFRTAHGGRHRQASVGIRGCGAGIG